MSVIYLTGFMGSGKSAIGKRLAVRLDRPFYDLDATIEGKESSSIKQIFKNFGEAHFRELEAQQLQRLTLDHPNAVIGLGGGAMCSEANATWIRTHGTSIYLDVSDEILLSRVRRNKKRPLLLNEDGSMKSKEELLSLIKEMKRKREPWYSQADIRVELNQEQDRDLTVTTVLNLLTSYYGH